VQRIHPTVFVAPGAQVYGRVEIAEYASLWPGAVIRCECLDVRIGRMTNVQDHAVIHVGFEEPTRIGEFCSIAHRAVVHGAVIEDHSLVGIGATVMNGAVIGRGSIVGAHALVPEGKVFPAGSIVVGVPAKRVGERDCARENRLNAWLYHRNAEAYRRGEHRAWEGPVYHAWRAALLEEIERDGDLARELPGC
jgi:carbonic anhydrase/acetyltransferase-like protein (isoleucine patch superfamily)